MNTWLWSCGLELKTQVSLYVLQVYVCIISIAHTLVTVSSSRPAYIRMVILEIMESFSRFLYMQNSMQFSGTIGCRICSEWFLMPTAKSDGWWRKALNRTTPSRISNDSTLMGFNSLTNGDSTRTESAESFGRVEVTIDRMVKRLLSVESLTQAAWGISSVAQQDWRLHLTLTKQIGLEIVYWDG